MFDFVGALGAVVNGGWGYRLEQKTARHEAKFESIEKLTDDRHEAVCARIDRLESRFDRFDEKLDRIVERK